MATRSLHDYKGVAILAPSPSHLAVEGASGGRDLAERHVEYRQCSLKEPLLSMRSQRLQGKESLRDWEGSRKRDLGLVLVLIIVATA